MARNTSPPEFASLVDDLEERVFGVLPDETWVYPGHGDDTTLGKERPSLPEWRARGRGGGHPRTRPPRACWAVGSTEPTSGRGAPRPTRPPPPPRPAPPDPPPPP